MRHLINDIIFAEISVLQDEIAEIKEELSKTYESYEEHRNILLAELEQKEKELKGLKQSVGMK